MKMTRLGYARREKYFYCDRISDQMKKGHERQEKMMMKTKKSLT